MVDNIKSRWLSWAIIEGSNEHPPDTNRHQDRPVMGGAVQELAFVVACGGIALIVNWLTGAVFPWLAAQPGPVNPHQCLAARRWLRWDYGRCETI